MTSADLNLIQRCQRGDPTAFDELYSMFGDGVWRLCCRMVSSTADAEDLAQEVWCTVWRQVRTFRCESSFKTWLYRVASNTCLMWLRKQPDIREVMMDDCAPDHSPTTESQVEQRQELQKVLDAMSRLPDTLRLPLVLRVDEELSYAEIADVLECSMAAVKMRVSRARVMLMEATMEDVK